MFVESRRGVLIFCQGDTAVEATNRKREGNELHHVPITVEILRSKLKIPQLRWAINTTSVHSHTNP